MSTLSVKMSLLLFTNWNPSLYKDNINILLGSGDYHSAKCLISQLKLCQSAIPDSFRWVWIITDIPKTISIINRH